MSKIFEVLYNQDYNQDEHPLCVVKLVTTFYQKGNGFFWSKEIRPLKRKCKGYNILTEDVSNIGIKEVLTKIINIEKCDDGIYKLIICNTFRDWETGHINDYDYKLIPFKKVSNV